MTARIRTAISREMPPEIASARIEDFRDRFGEAHYCFAQHAAFPLALTPDLLYRMRESFQRTSDEKKPLNISWIAIADLLLSPLCEEADIGYELYEMDVSIRAQLLEELRADPDFGAKRLEELAYFLRNYIEEQLTSPDPMILDLAQSQAWTVLAYIKPDQAAQELAEQIRILYTNGSLEQVRITSIMETLKALNTPLAAFEGFQPLLTYAQFQAHSILGHPQAADVPAQIEQATTEVAASLGINLPTYRKRATSSNRTQQEPDTIKDFYISHHIADHDWAEWIANQLQEVGYSVNWGFQFGPSSSLDIDTSALHNQARHTIALLSPDYLSVDSVQQEWTAMLAPSPQQEQKLLLPIRVRSCTPGGIFASIQYLDLVKQDEATAREMLLQFVRRSFLNARKPAVGDDDESRIQELEIRAKTDQDAAAYVELGNLYEKLRRIDDAIRAYEEARSLQPSDTNVLLALSRLYNDTGSYERVVEILDQLIKLQPDFADAYKQRGLMYRREADADYAATGDSEQRSIKYNKAVADLERAVELRPGFEEALGSLGGLYQRIGNYERATEYYQRLYTVNPSSSYALGNLASLFWYVGRREEASNYFKSLEEASQTRLKEGREEAYWDYYDLALSQLATGKIDAAKETYAKAVEETPAIAQFNAVLNNLYFLQRAQEPIKGLEEIIPLIENAKDVMGANDSARG